MLDFIVKVGGSVLTDKSAYETVRPEAVEESVRILSELFREGKKFIVLHGVGSFGHHLASEHRLNDGYSKGDEGAPLILARLRASVLKLNRLIIEGFLSRGVPAVTVSTFEDWKTRGGKRDARSTWAIERLLREGLLPVLHGDWVFDDLQGCGILSSDVIMEVLCETSPPGRVVFVMDCGCILTHPPGHPDSRPIRRLHVSDDEGSDPSNQVEMNSLVPDASGGVRGKLRAAISICRGSKGSISVLFCSLGAVAEALGGSKEVTGDRSTTELVFAGSRDA